MNIPIIPTMMRRGSVSQWVWKATAFVLCLCLLPTGGCVSPHGGPGPLCPLYWGHRAAEALQRDALINGTDGSSPQTALAIQGFRKKDLPWVERNWVYEKHWAPLFPLDMHREFSDSVSQKTLRIDKRVYDVVILTMPDGQSRMTYFDVTNYKYFWPKRE